MDSADEFDVIQFEKKLTTLKDTQESIQTVSQWCLQNRVHHKKIVSSWLNVLKQVKIEHRLTLFYLANDVIQYSKRKHYEFVESWGTSLQRATTMVRDDKIKHKIIRILQIWEQRAIFTEEFLADLNGLLNVNPVKKQQPKDVDGDEFQPTVLVANIRECMKLETETDSSIQSYTKSKSSDLDNVKLTSKDREQVEEVEREISDRKHKLEFVIRCLNEEIKARGILIAAIEQADSFYTTQRGEVKVVANAYRNFGNRIKNMKKKLEELQTTLPSPIPSPDINAPSPEPDNDFVLPDETDYFQHQANMMGYIGSKLPFDINDFNSESPRDSAQPIQVISSCTPSKDDSSFNLNSFFKSYMNDAYSPTNPLPVPPVPGGAGGGGYHSQPQQMQYQPQPRPMPQYPPNQMTNNPFNPPPRHTSEYGISEIPLLAPLLPPPMPPSLGHNETYDPMNWIEDGNSSWDPTDFVDLTETPISPPHFEQEGIDTDLVEYIDGDNSLIGAELDIDHRQLTIPKMEHTAPINITKGRAVDIDHRNLISLTGSPVTKSTDEPLKPPPIAPPLLWSGGDMDFRQDARIPPPPKQVNMGNIDIDYRNSPSMHKNQTKVSSSISSNLIKINPPPPPPSFLIATTSSPNVSVSKVTPKITSPNLITVPISTTAPTNTTTINTAAILAAAAPPPPPPLKPSLLDEMDEFLKNTEAEMLASNAAQKAKDELLKTKSNLSAEKSKRNDNIESIDMDIVSDEDNDDIYNFIEEDLMKIEADKKSKEKSNDVNMSDVKSDATQTVTTSAGATVANVTTAGETTSISTPATVTATTTTTSVNTNPFNNLLQMNPQQTLQEQIHQISQQIQQHFNNPIMVGNTKAPMPPLPPPPRMPLLSTPNMKFGAIPAFGDMGSPFSGSPELQNLENNANSNENWMKGTAGRTSAGSDTSSGLTRGPLFPPNGPENIDNNNPLPPGVTEDNPTKPSGSEGPSGPENVDNLSADRSLGSDGNPEGAHFGDDATGNRDNNNSPFGRGGPNNFGFGNIPFGGGGGPNNSFGSGSGGPNNSFDGGSIGPNNSYRGVPGGPNNSFNGGPGGSNSSFGGGPGGPNNSFGGPNNSFGGGPGGNAGPPFRGPNNSYGHGGNQGPFGGPPGGQFGGPPGPLMNSFGGGGPNGPGGPFQQRQFSPQMMNNSFSNNNNNFRGNARGMPYFRQGGRGGGPPGGNRGRPDGGPGGGNGQKNIRGGGGRGNFRGNNQRGGMW